MGSNTFNNGGVGANTLGLINAGYDQGVFFDGQYLFVADTDNNRVLVYNGIPTSNGAAATFVIGQPNFTSSLQNQGLSGPTSQTLSWPTALWVADGSLFVADNNNNRVLVYNNGGQGIDTLASNDPPADVVIGQANMTSGHANQGGGVSPYALAGPSGVCVDNCQLYISDAGNARVLVYNPIPLSASQSNPSATGVLGQTSLTAVSSSSPRSPGT